MENVMINAIGSATRKRGRNLLPRIFTDWNSKSVKSVADFLPNSITGKVAIFNLVWDAVGLHPTRNAIARERKVDRLCAVMLYSHH